jgi:hypothetical protein
MCAHETSEAKRWSRKLEPSNTSPAKVKQASGNLGRSVKALSSAASRPPARRVADHLCDHHLSVAAELGRRVAGVPATATLGKAIGQLERSLNQTMSQLKCGS